MKKVLLSCFCITATYAGGSYDIAKIAQVLTAVGGTISAIDVLTGGTLGVMTHGEVEYGRGTMSLEGGFLGLNGKISDNIDTYTLKDEHHNTSVKHLNYNYKISWYDSNTLDQSISTYNGYVTDINGYTGNALTIPSVGYKIQGLDADVGLGWNLIDLGEHDYFSIGLDLGVSMPWIEAADTSSSSSSSSTDSIASLYGTGTTKMWTYKVGPQMRVSKSLTSDLSLYGSAIYAYQNATIKNSSVDLNVHVDGEFTESELGLRYQPLETNYRITNWFSVTPRLYFTAGVRYNQWVLHDVAIQLFDQNIPLPKSDMKVSSSTTYFGLGYGF